MANSKSMIRKMSCSVAIASMLVAVIAPGSPSGVPESVHGLRTNTRRPTHRVNGHPPDVNEMHQPRMLIRTDGDDVNGMHQRRMWTHPDFQKQIEPDFQPQIEPNLQIMTPHQQIHPLRKALEKRDINIEAVFQTVQLIEPLEERVLAFETLRDGIRNEIANFAGQVGSSACDLGELWSKFTRLFSLVIFSFQIQLAITNSKVTIDTFGTKTYQIQTMEIQEWISFGTFFGTAGGFMDHLLGIGAIGHLDLGDSAMWMRQVDVDKQIELLKQTKQIVIDTYTKQTVRADQAKPINGDNHTKAYLGSDGKVLYNRGIYSIRFLEF
jgi:hypothetical protein